jgi:hypothetical protein
MNKHEAPWLLWLNIHGESAPDPQEELAKLSQVLFEFCPQRIVEGKSICDIAIDVIKDFYRAVSTSAIPM